VWPQTESISLLESSALIVGEPFRNLFPGAERIDAK
jgi:hypothetical protein